MVVIGIERIQQFGGVIDDPHGGDGVEPEMGTHQQGLGVAVADAADAAAAVEIAQIAFEFRAERRALDIVDLPLKGMAVADGHAAAAGAQMRVVVYAEKHVERNVAA